MALHVDKAGSWSPRSPDKRCGKPRIRHDGTLKLISTFRVLRPNRLIDCFNIWIFLRTWQAKALESERASLESFLQPLNSQLRDLDDQVGKASDRYTTVDIIL